MIRVAPIRFAENVRECAEFYALLGLTEDTTQTSDNWSTLDAPGGAVNIHIAEKHGSHSNAGTVSLQFAVDEGELNDLHQKLSQAGHTPAPVVDETFGRFFTVTDPDGYEITVFETPDELKVSY